MEPRLGHDFSSVAIHDGPAAAKAAAALDARAFTVGRDIVFGARQYAPETREGRRLIAHELAHVVQQGHGGRAPRPSQLQLSAPSEPAEREAEVAAALVVDNRAVPALRPVALGVRRACGPRALGRPKRQCERSESPAIGQQFGFVVSCDDLRPGEAARVAAFARGLRSGTRLKVHGYASEEGREAFNHALSCHRANVIVDMLRAARADCPVIAVFEHGPQALPPSRAFWRSVIVEEIRPQESRPQRPEDCARLVGSCEFYRCRQRRTGNTHPATAYYLGYGLKYCLRFSQQTRPRLSRAGQIWLDQTLLCLQEHIQRSVPYDAPPDVVKRSAFDSHPHCYVASGLCLLPPSDWMAIWASIDSSDNELRQVLVTAIDCAASLGGLGAAGIMPIHSLAAGGGYRGLMERDWQQAFGRRTRKPFPPPEATPHP